MNDKWIVCQLGAREHYTIPRALHRSDQLAVMLTDYWVKPGSILTKLPKARRLSDRFHPDLTKAPVEASNLFNLAHELGSRLKGESSMEGFIHKNRLYQQFVIKELQKLDLPKGTTLFAYSYAADMIFKYAKTRGWRTVLGQFDPGPEEERLVQQEVSAHPAVTTSWKPVPEGYYQTWVKEYDLADRVVVNSEWSLQCLHTYGLPVEKVRIVPLVYQETGKPNENRISNGETFKVLFLGQINLRKGIVRLIKAMEQLREEPIELLLAGPTEVDPSLWSHLPNVRWVGSVPRSEVSHYYEISDVFILPTLSDGFALTQLEALHYGIPVIASKYCGKVVTSGRNGWILENLEPETIASTLRTARQESKNLGSIHPPSFNLSDLNSALNRLF